MSGDTDDDRARPQDGSEASQVAADAGSVESAGSGVRQEDSPSGFEGGDIRSQTESGGSLDLSRDAAKAQFNSEAEPSSAAADEQPSAANVEQSSAAAVEQASAVAVEQASPVAVEQSSAAAVEQASAAAAEQPTAAAESADSVQPVQAVATLPDGSKS
ncbi:MAG: hypothetical protein EB088_11800 [Betaproteobacteria bacterium]|nr:hypothetical protein [Betaproteobacteria bacterium]